MTCSQLRHYNSPLGRRVEWTPPRPFDSLAPEGSLSLGKPASGTITPRAPATPDPGGEFCFTNEPREACNSITGLNCFPFSCLPEAAVSEQRHWNRKKNDNNSSDEKSENSEHHKVCARQHCPCSPQAAGAPGIPTTKEAEGVMEEGASDLTAGRGWGAASPSISFGKKKKKKNVKKNDRKGTQAALRSAGCGAQNWPALLGSHCRRRTMDGSLLAPRMNSSRDSFPSLLVSIWRKIFSVLFSGVDSSSGIFITEETIL